MVPPALDMSPACAGPPPPRSANRNPRLLGPCFQGCASASLTAASLGLPRVGRVLPTGIKWVGAPLQLQQPFCRRRVGQDPTLPTHTLLLGDGLTGLGHRAAEAPLTMAAQRFYHILHVAASSGEHEKVVQVTARSLNLFPGAVLGCSLVPRQ